MKDEILDLLMDLADTLVEEGDVSLDIKVMNRLVRVQTVGGKLMDKLSTTKSHENEKYHDQFNRIIDRCNSLIEAIKEVIEDEKEIKKEKPVEEKPDRYGLRFIGSEVEE